MTKLPRAQPSAVAILETPDHFLAEGRPTKPGSLAYSGRIQFFGGHMDDGELPAKAIRRELIEELGLELTADPSLLWDGEVESQLRDGTPALRYVNLYHVPVSNADDLAMQIPGDIISIPKTPEGVDAYHDRLTKFAHDSLTKFLSGEYNL